MELKAELGDKGKGLVLQIGLGFPIQGIFWSLGIDQDCQEDLLGHAHVMHHMPRAALFVVLYFGTRAEIDGNSTPTCVPHVDRGSDRTGQNHLSTHTAWNG